MKSREPKNQSKSDVSQFEAITDFFENDPVDLIEKIGWDESFITYNKIIKY